MENKKYELVKDDFTHVNNKKLYRIKSLRDFGKVKTGDLGGFIEKEENLSHEGNCWVYNEAKVFDDAIVEHDAQVKNMACAYEQATIRDKALVMDASQVRGNGNVYGAAILSGLAVVQDFAWIDGRAQVFERATISGVACIMDKAMVHEQAVVTGQTRVSGSAEISGEATVRGIVHISGDAEISGDAVIEYYEDYIVFKNNWSSGRSFTWTKSNDMWQVGCFYGTGEELIKKAYEDSDLSGACYEAYVNLVKIIEQKKESYYEK